MKYWIVRPVSSAAQEVNRNRPPEQGLDVVAVPLGLRLVERLLERTRLVSCSATPCCSPRDRGQSRSPRSP